MDLVNVTELSNDVLSLLLVKFDKNTMNIEYQPEGKVLFKEQLSDCMSDTSRSSLIWVYTVCLSLFVRKSGLNMIFTQIIFSINAREPLNMSYTFKAMAAGLIGLRSQMSFKYVPILSSS